MAKRNNAIGKPQNSHSHKTKKRLAIKQVMLDAKKKSPKFRNKMLKKFNS